MDKKNANKKINILMILIIIFILILIILAIFLSNVKKHSINNIYSRLKNGLNNLNYTYVDNSFVNYPQKCQVFGKKEKITDKDGNIRYLDYDTKKTINTYPSVKHKDMLNNNGLEDIEYYNKYISVYFESGAYECTYKGKEEYNGNQCSVYELVNSTGDGAIFWINDKVDIIDKVTYFTQKWGERSELKTEELRLHTGENTYNDVAIPSYVETEYSDDTNG